jgi:NADH:ubiquinone oxidoreductase subunit 3 (subunit A)
MEIIILVPIVVNILSLPIISYYVLWVVLFILVLSYWYEWEKYALQWGFN